MLKHTRPPCFELGKKFSLMQPLEIKIREGVLPLTKANIQGVINREPRGINDDYQGLFLSRTEQDPKYYKRIPKMHEDPSTFKINWWRQALPYIAPVDIMTDGLAINQINDTALYQQDFSGQFDMEDLKNVKPPHDAGIPMNKFSKEAMISKNRNLANSIIKTRKAVSNDIITDLIKKQAEINRLQGNYDQLLIASKAMISQSQIAKGKKTLFNPHLRNNKNFSFKSVKSKQALL